MEPVTLRRSRPTPWPLVAVAASLVFLAIGAGYVLVVAVLDRL